MQIAIINLESEPDRWSTAAGRFSAAGLQAVRHEAISGNDLTPAQIDEIYSERLNRQHYHRRLQPGEIGCYASHLAAWRSLLESGEPALAVFEDDVEFDSDLPAVLQAVSATSSSWDLVKLVGREQEKIGSHRPLCGKRDLIAYRRVPSLTGAYVLSAEGARKLLARRLPFGRPVDVDLRYWWECGLVIRGVFPYPVEGAASSRISTIGERVSRRTGDRLKKLRLQATYTYLNWAARRSPQFQPVHGGPSSQPSSDRDIKTTASEAVAPIPRRSNLVVVRAGDSSLHPDWLRASGRHFDIFVSYYGSTTDRYREEADHYEMRLGPKWPCIAALLEQRPQLMQNYEAVWFPDDDLATEGAEIDRMFAFVCAYRLCLAQPALTRDSFHTWNTLLQDPRCHIRYTGFVEVMAPIFSRDALRACAPTFSQSPSGWGLDWIWPRLCQRAGLDRIAILDATPVRHTRPVGGELYRRHPEMDPRADAARVLKRYGVEEVRAVAKYSFQHQVRDVALPLRERFVFWLKRINGRRKHRANA